MASQLDIYNSALVKLGEEPLVSPTTDSKAGLLTRTRYEMCRDFVLIQHPWKCAIKRISLSPVYSPPPSSPPPPAGVDGTPFNPNGIPLSDPNSLRQWQYACNFPSDFLRLVLTDDDKLNMFQIEGKQILTNEQIVVIRYIWKVNDPSIFSPDLAEAIAWYLAADISLAIIQNTNVTDRLYKSYEMYLSKAKFRDSATSRAVTQNEYFFEESRLQANHL